LAHGGQSKPQGNLSVIKMKRYPLIKYLLIASLVLTIGTLFIPFSLFDQYVINSLNRVSPVKFTLIGKIHYRLIRPDLIELENIKVEYHGWKSKVDRLKLDIELLALLKRKLVFEEVTLGIEEMTYQTFKEENKNKESKSREESAFEIKKIVFNKLKSSIGKLKFNEREASDLNFTLAELELDLVSMGTKGSVEFSLFNKFLKAEVNLSNLHRDQVMISMNTPDLNSLSKELRDKPSPLTGPASAQINLDIFKNSGQFKLESKDLLWPNKDLDSILNAYIDSKQVGILEAAGVLTLGPLGILVAKGLDLGKSGLYSLKSGKTKIKHLYLQGSFNPQEISFSDAAFITDEHRIAAGGSIEQKSDDYYFKDFVVASVDAKGCSIFKQELSGKVSSPQVGALKTFVTELVSQAQNVLKRISSLIIEDCDDFYSGKVKALKQ